MAGSAEAVSTRAAIASFPAPLERNPYQRLLYAQLTAHGFPLVAAGRLRFRWLWQARRSVRFLHFHWPQGYWRYNRSPRRLRRPMSWVTAAVFVARLQAARLLGYRIVWTVHQVYPHEIDGRRLDRLGTRALARASDLLLAHDAGTAEVVRHELGSAARKLEIVPHGSYIGVYPEGRPRAEVRRALGIAEGAFVFLCFGELRAYKEVDSLLRAFRAAALPDAVLVVAGTVVNDEQAAAVRQAAEADARIRPLLEPVPDEGVTELFGAADAAVLTRRDGGTSGALILALSFGVPVVAARRPT
jgi:beta-1,4-mannosyltransferase